MLYLHVSNRTENLLTHLAEVLAVSGRGDIFSRECFLIQSQGMERLISQYLAARFTSWCNYSFYLPLAFIQYSGEQLGINLTRDGYERNSLTWCIESLLRDLPGDEYAPIQKYLLAKQNTMRRYQLAEQLAHVFDQYQLMRPEMLNGWSRGRLVTDDPSELWQRAIWCRLQSSLGDIPHRGEMLEMIIEKLNANSSLSDLLPNRLSVFGLSIMPPLFLRYLQGLAQHLDVHLYVLSPCREYWGDIPRRRSQLLTGQIRPDGSIDPDPVPETHPLLIGLGQQGRDFQRMLFADVDFELEFASYEDPVSESCEPTLLNKLQSDLLSGTVSPQENGWPEEDRSIRIVSCHTRLREIMVLKDHILQLVADNPSFELRDMVVMAPDIQQYAALIPAIFHDIPHAVSDRSLRRRNPVLAAFSDFLKLLNGRFGWDEVMDLLKKQVVADKLGLSGADLEIIQRWVVDAGVRWGISESQRSEMGLPPIAETTWCAGLERLLMGYAMESDDYVDGVLPYTQIEGSGGAPLGALCRFIDILEGAKKTCAGSHSLRKWSNIFHEYGALLFADESGYGDSQDYLELREIIGSLGEAGEQFHEGAVDFRVICHWLENTAKETRSSSGFLRGQLTFCSMLPMRSIPFKVVCLIGLNDGEFPKIDSHPTFDLLGKQHRPGDRSKRMDDRYQFLEALVAARECLYLSYVGQSVKNNEEIPPAVVITELVEVLQGYYRVDRPVKKHPLLPFSSRYFDGSDPLLFSHDKTSLQVARQLQQEVTAPDRWWQGHRPLEIIDLSVEDLFSFLGGPQRWFVRNQLKVSLRDDNEQVGETEPFLTEGLDNYHIDQELVELMLSTTDYGEMLKTHRRLCSEGRWPLGEPGMLKFKNKVATLTDFTRLVREAGVGSKVADLKVDLHLAGFHLQGKLSNVHQGGILLCRFTSLKGKDLLSGWLHHLLFKAMTGRWTETHIFGSDTRVSFQQEGEDLPGLETFLDIFRAGCRAPSSLYVEPGLAWLRKVPQGLEKAREAAAGSLTRELEAGYDQELALIARGWSPKELLDDDFERICMEFLAPIWSCANE